MILTTGVDDVARCHRAAPASVATARVASASNNEGKKIKPGTKMVNAITLKRGKAENSEWLVDGGKIDVDKPCSTGSGQ